MPSNLQLLVQLVGQYAAKARRQTQYADVFEEDILAFELGCYLSMIEASITAIPDYKPIKELDMILDVADKLKKSGRVSQMKDYWDALSQHGETLIHLLNKSEPPLAKSYLEKFALYAGGERGPLSALGDIEAPQTDKSSGAVDSFESILGRELSSNCSKETYERLREVWGKIERGEQGLDDLNLCLKWIFDAFATRDFDNLNMIPKLFEKVDNKRQLAASFLVGYQSSYDSYDRHWDINQRNRLLYKFTDLTSCLESIVSKKEIIALMEESSFDLSNPRKSENDDAYRRYTLGRSVCCGELKLSSLEEEDYYSSRVMGSISASLMGRIREELSLDEHQAYLTGTMPPLIQLALDADGEKTKTAFITFNKTFLRVNASADKQHYRHPDSFFTRHQAAIAQVIQLFGLAGVKTLTKQLASTVVSLERYLENTPVLDADYIDPLKAYFERHKALIQKNPDEQAACHKIMLVLSTLCEIETGEMGEAEMTDYKALVIKSMADDTPQTYLKVLVQKLLSSMLGEFDVDVAKIDVEAIFKRMPPEKFSQLAAASINMQDSPYRDVFCHLLYLDLTEGDIDAFLHKLEQPDYLGQSLAEHNQRIREKLEAQGISPSDALKYRKTRELIVYPSDKEAVKTDNALTVLWGYGTKFQAPLKEKIDALVAMGKGISVANNKILQQCLSIQKQYMTLQNQMNGKKEEAPPHTVLAKSSSQPLLDKIERNLKALQELDTKHRDNCHGEPPLFTAGFMEFLGHVRSQYKICKQLMSGEKSKKKAKSQEIHHFRLVQWDKTHPMTSFLGDEVGCCLGSTSDQFPALVQRRMDDGMLFHVAVDLKTNKPRALIWLYLAEKPNGKIALVANFFEVNAKYGLEKSARKALLNGLLAFTNDYCKDNPNIDGFYMSQLTYGWNVNDLNSYPLVDLEIKDKLGGPFIPGRSPADFAGEDAKKVRALTVNHYYLASLANGGTQFHKFSEEVLAQDKAPHGLELVSLLQQEVDVIQKANGGTLTLAELKGIIIREHWLEIAPFFVEPLSSSQHFHDLLEIVYQTPVCDAAMSLEKKLMLPDVQQSPEKLLAEKGMFSERKEASNKSDITEASTYTP